MRHLAAGVVVVTAPGDPPAGFTATSFTSVSDNPPLVSFNRRWSRHRRDPVAESSYIAVHLLCSDQEQVARTFATSGIDKFTVHSAWQWGPQGVPLLDDVLARIVCRVEHRIAVNDHILVLATPFSGEHVREEAAVPLLYHSGRYASLR